MKKVALHAACVSHKGRVRANNEDNFFFNNVILSVIDKGSYSADYFSFSFPQFFAVFDGMGGESNGEEASSIAASLFKDAVTKQHIMSEKYKAELVSYINDVNEKICGLIRERGSRMGTTMATLAVWDNFIHIANIGDSRVYRLHKGCLKQLSVDHTSIQMMLEKGVLTEEQAAKSPHKNQLTQHLGVCPEELTIEAQMASSPFSVGDAFLLCSDGLTGLIGDTELEQQLNKDGGADYLASGLLESALSAGGTDNITIIVVKAVAKRMIKRCWS